MQQHKINATATIDGSLYAGLAELTPDDDHYVVTIGPTVKFTGRLVEQELDLPLSDRQVRCAISIEYPDGTSTSAFGRSATTDEDGKFEIDGLIPGETYSVTVVTEIGPDGHGRSFRNVAEVTIAEEAVVEREFRVSALDFPPTFAPIGQ